MISVRPMILRPCKIRTMRPIFRRVSPIASDIMASFDARGSGLSAMLLVFLVGRIVIDAAEVSAHNDRKYEISDSDSDDD